MTPYYVITEPEHARRIYETWDECKEALVDLKGAKHQKVQNLEQARAMIEGGGVMLEPGLHVFTDGNADGGVGVVVAWMPETPDSQPALVTEISTSVDKVFYGHAIPGLDVAEGISAALDRSRNVLAELGGLYLALWQAPEEAALTIVHDYEGLAKWMSGEWKVKDEVLRRVVETCTRMKTTKRLDLAFVWQKGHTSSWAGRHDLAKLNARADELATRGARA